MIYERSLKEKISKKLKDYYPDRKLSIRDMTLVKNVRAMVLRFDLFEDNHKANEIYVKILEKGAKEQVLELKNLNEYKDLLLMPRIIDFFEDFNAVVMEGVKGGTLSKALVFYTLPIVGNFYEVRLLDYARKIGRGLGLLHKFTERRKLRIGDMNLGMITGVKVSPYIRTLLGVDLFNNILNRIEEIEDEKASFVQVHRDPTPHNILVKRDEIHLVDFAFKRGASFEDTLAFSIGLELMENRLPFFSKSLLEEMKHLFFNYYEEFFHHPFEEDFWSFLKLLRCLQQLIVYNQRKTSLKNYILESIDKKYLLDRIWELSLKLNLR